MSNAITGDHRTAVVIEDDLEICNLTRTLLEQGGFHVSSAASGREGVDVVLETNPTVVTLDIGLPDIDGYEVLRRIRSTSDCYVIVLSERTEEMDILTALQAGADDYVLKPFRPRELRARIDAMLRRPRPGQNPNHLPAAFSSGASGGWDATPDAEPDASAQATEGSNRLLRNGSLVVDREARVATCSGVEVQLTKTEFNLLHELMQSNGAVRTKEDLVRVSRGREYRGYNFVSHTEERAIEVHIANLRQKFVGTTDDPDIITTVRGVGFRIAPLQAIPR